LLCGSLLVLSILPLRFHQGVALTTFTMCRSRKILKQSDKILHILMYFQACAIFLVFKPSISIDINSLSCATDLSTQYKMKNMLNAQNFFLDQLILCAEGMFNFSLRCVSQVLLSLYFSCVPHKYNK
jgi:hypothetical protein